MVKVSVLGAGSWGTALSKVLAENGHDVCVWSIDKNEVEMLSTKHEQTDKLPGVKLPETISYTMSLEEACKDREMLVMAVPSIFVRSTAKSVAAILEKEVLIVDVAKGIEEDTLLPMGDVILSECPKARVAVLSGPTHAEEVGLAMPTTIVAAATKKEDAEFVQNTFMNEYFRVYTSPDVLGVELGGSIKNVIALAAGMADGLKTGDNTKAALITRGIKEISNLGLAMGARAETIEGLSGMGDLIVTCASQHSRNRRAGMLMGQGYTMEEAMTEVHQVVEGVYSAKAAIALGRKYGIELPIIEGVNEVLFGGKSVRDGMYELMQRERKREHSSLEWE